MKRLSCALLLASLLSVALADEKKDYAAPTAPAMPAVHDHAKEPHDEHADHDGHDHDDEGHSLRLVVSDAVSHSLSVLDPKAGKVISSFGTVGKMSGLYTGPSAEYVYAIHRDNSRVTVLSSGLSTEDHGNHKDLKVAAPYVLATLNVGKQPTHFFSHGEQIVIYNDGDGSSAVFGEALLGKTNEMQFVQTEKPDHGAPALLGKTLLVGMLSLNRVDAYDLESGKFVKTVAPCTGVHGEAVRGNTVFFGCTDGVLAVTVSGKGDISSRKLNNPKNTPEKTRVGTVAAHEKSNVVYGNFGKGLAKWNANAKAGSLLSSVALPAQPLKFEFSGDGAHLYVLTADGQLHRLNAASSKVEASAKVVAPVDTADKASIRPSFVVTDEDIYLTSPTTGEVLAIAAKDLKVEQRWKVGGTPALIAASEQEGVQH